MEITDPLGAPITEVNKDQAKFSNDVDDFLQIFVAQLQNQDPMEPQDSSEFTQQIADLSSVEQAINTNSKLDELIQLSSVKDNSSVVSFIGKQVEAEGDLVSFLGTDTVPISYELDNATNPQDAFITVRDIDGNVVFNGEGTTNKGVNTVTWDGNDNQGNQVEPGLYQVILSLNFADSIERHPTYVQGRVVGANLEADEPTLIVNGMDIPLADVRFIGEPTV